MTSSSAAAQLPPAHLHVAAALALGSALCIGVGDVLQQRAARRTADQDLTSARLLVRLISDRRWRWGAVLLAASIALQALALGFGPVLLVQSLVMLSLLFALPINARLSHRKLSAAEWIWAVLLTGAIIVFVTVGRPQPGNWSAPGDVWIQVAGILGPIFIGCVVLSRIYRGALAAVLLAFVSGASWAVFAILTKAVLARSSSGARLLATTPELYAWLLALLAGFACGQAAFRAGPLTASMPTLQVSQPVVAAVLGIVVLDETLGTGRAGATVLAIAALVMVLAIGSLARVEAAAVTDEPGRRPRHQPT